MFGRMADAGVVEVHPPTVGRTPLLANSAAEFIENRLDGSLGPRFAQIREHHEFVPELDGFRPKAEGVSQEVYYEQSRKHLKQFQGTLAKFHTLLKDKDLERKLGLPAKKLEKYDIHDVFNVADMLAKKHKITSDNKGPLGKIRKGFRLVGKSNAIQALLGFAPTDVYGSLICGSFTLVLGVDVIQSACVNYVERMRRISQLLIIGAYLLAQAIERCDSLRDTIYAALAIIPEKLENVREYCDIHYKSVALHLKADGVFVSVFVLLEKIIAELTKGLAAKSMSALLKGKKYGDEIVQAVKDFEDKLNALHERAKLDHEKRLGRVENSSAAILENIILLREETTARANDLKEIQNKMNAMDINETRTVTREEMLRGLQMFLGEESPMVNMLNRTYSLLTSSGRFDPIDGGLICRPLLEDTEKPSSPPVMTKEAAWQIAKDWNKHYLQDFPGCANEDIKKNQRALLDKDDQERVKWILASNRMLDWIRSRGSTALLLQCEESPEEVENCLSFTTAFIAYVARQECPYPVLYHSCGLRGLGGPRKGVSDALALVNSMNAQLISHLANMESNRPDLAFLQDKKDERGKPDQRFRKTSQRRHREALELFHRLIQLLPKESLVFIIIDSLSRLPTSGDQKALQKIIKAVCGLAEGDEIRIRAKILLSDAMFGSVKRPGNLNELYIPNHVDGDGQGLNLFYLREEVSQEMDSSLSSASETDSD